MERRRYKGRDSSSGPSLSVAQHSTENFFLRPLIMKGFNKTEVCSDEGKVFILKIDQNPEKSIIIPKLWLNNKETGITLTLHV